MTIFHYSKGHEMKLKIEYLNKEDLKPYANNAKIHTGEQIEQIKKSIEEFGFNDPIAIWHDNEIIEGHGRLLAVMEMDDIEQVPVIRLDGLTDEQRKAYMLVHNQTTMNTGYDIDLLALELDELDNFDASAFGFDEIDEIVDDIVEVEEKPEIEFAEVLNEQNNYIVLKFNNEVDWLQLQSVYPLHTVKNYSTKKDGNGALERTGVGRVVDGVDFINALMGDV